ncbi:MAG: HAMP domain-containing protein [Clostridiaceae bacterium]|nr:HAMP domain-containing protein [Clostridiaceae bacterium]
MNTANKTENLKDDIKVSFASEKRKSKSQQKNSKISGPRNKHKKTSGRTGFSMSRRISVSYTQMLIDTFLSCLILIIIVYVVFNLVVVGTETRGIIEDLLLSDNLSESIFDIAVQKDTEIALFDSTGEIIINTFKDFSKPHHQIPLWFYRKDRSIFIMFKSYISNSDGVFEVNIFRNVTKTLIEMMILFGFSAVLYGIVTIIIYFRGNSITKNVLNPIAEMTKMTKEIKAQNLNLRLNVTNAKDELKELVITFNEMMDRIEAAYNKQNQFVSDASHELRTPISVIQGYTRMLERWGKDDPEVLTEAIDAIAKETDNMKELVEKLLFIARNDKDTLSLNKGKFSLSDMMEELVKETRMVNKHHIIEDSIEKNIDIIGDRNRIKQAMRIFTDNAQKYTEPGKKIEISLKKEENQAVMTVKDSGCGIDINDIHNIFDRFYRADQSRDRNKGGHGLGLSIARIIILRHGGKIRVKSKLGEGSTFSVILNIE